MSQIHTARWKKEKTVMMCTVKSLSIIAADRPEKTKDKKCGEKNLLWGSIIFTVYTSHIY
jgi:hypothetical protein